MYELDLFLPSHRCLTPPSWETPCDINVIYTSLKSTFSGLQFSRWQYGCLHSFSCYCLRNTRNVAKFQENLPYSSSRSSKVIDLGVNGKLICDFLLVINCNYNFNCNLTVSAIVFEIYMLKDRKLLILPTPPLFDAPSRGIPLEFLDETYPAKTRGMGLPYGGNFTILLQPFFYDPPVWQTDGRQHIHAIAYMLSRAKISSIWYLFAKKWRWICNDAIILQTKTVICIY